MSNRKNGDNNENDCDNPGLFLRTPNEKGRQIYFADSETKMNVSPFFNKK